ncbi:hypothetical protein [Qipengyuania zhejiangensis]|uniref:hypothetical protein n=1 Tax=Qipengyuania zhejiangensis TaxID=3077782 RepID=UPI002D786597|nr:hypothetical protein [Qipengyuania sp. Z2]
MPDAGGHAGRLHHPGTHRAKLGKFWRNVAPIAGNTLPLGGDPHIYDGCCVSTNS